MRARALPRIVLVTRKTPLQLLELRHGTLSQAEFYLRSRGEDIREVREAHERLEGGFARVVAALPPDQRRTRVDRDQLDRFQFAADDVVLVVGQDGLIPNAAKYLDGQIAIGINPDPDRYDGVLCRHPPERTAELLAWLREPDPRRFRLERRTMLEAEREDGQRLLALNEVYVGHQTHQSARYRLRFGEREERQSSSGLICATGTGCTGWALSIALQRRLAAALPKPEEDCGAWFVREPFPSVHTQISLDHGTISRAGGLAVVSEMASGGVAFADGIESDRIEFSDGETLRVRLAERKLSLVVEAERRGESDERPALSAPVAPSSPRRRSRPRRGAR